ncbi:MAG: glycosyltransferase family A protein [Hyphomicrobium sp.]|nr:glycosyltransferase family A protein [Hyphomicrobium sp.]
MASAPLVSIIIPTFNRPRATRRAVMSVVDQQGFVSGDLEVIVVDDASPHPLTLEDVPDFVRVTRLARNGGAAAARNEGLSLARGKFIAFLDSDDVWGPDKLAAQLEFHQACVGAGSDAKRLVVTCGFYMPRRSGGDLEWRIPVEARTPGDFARGCWHCPGSTLFAHRDVFHDVGVLDEELRRLEDLEWFLRFGLLGGELRTVAWPHTIISPSGYSEPTSIAQAAERIHARLAEQPLAALDPSGRRSISAYLDVELAAAHLAHRRKATGAGYLVRSFLRKPRLRLMPGDFWVRGRKIPPEVRDIYRTMTEPEEQYPL